MGHTGWGRDRQTDRQHQDEAPGGRGCGKGAARGPGEPSGWGGMANVINIPGSLSENQNPNSKNATLRVRRDPGAHPVQALISS